MRTLQSSPNGALGSASGVPPSLFGHPLFWVLQFAAWPLVAVVCLGHRTFHDLKNEAAPPAEAVAILGLFAVLGLLGSSVLGRAYLALPESWITGERSSTRLAGVTLALSAVITSVSVPVVYAAYASTSWQSPWFISTVPYWCSLYLFVVFVVWSGVFHGARYQVRFRHERQRLRESEALAREAQLEALRLRLNPHFFFNALNSVIGLVEVDPRGAQDMLRHVAALMRRTLDGASFELVRLEEELDLVGQYLRCEEFRFGDQLAVSFDVPTALRRKPVPGMLLQPLVENAIQHGRMRGRVLRVRIVARSEGDRLRLEVRNSGALGRFREAERSGSGLQLARRRLRVRFPTSGDLELREEPGWVVASVSYAPTEATSRL